MQWLEDERKRVASTAAAQAVAKQTAAFDEDDPGIWGQKLGVDHSLETDWDGRTSS